jgi:hypothetical protein
MAQATAKGGDGALGTLDRLRNGITQVAEDAKKVAEGVLKDQLPPGIDIKAVLKLYNKFNIIRYIEEWGNVRILLMPRHARLGSPIACAKTPFSSCPYSSPMCES